MQQTAPHDVSPAVAPVLLSPHVTYLLAHLCADVAEDNIIPIARLVAQHDPEFSTHVGRAPGDILRSLVEGFSSLGRHFLRPVEGKEGRLVFVPHPETLIRFPDEEAKAKAYLEKGEW